MWRKAIFWSSRRAAITCVSSTNCPNPSSYHRQWKNQPNAPITSTTSPRTAWIRRAFLFPHGAGFIGRSSPKPSARLCPPGDPQGEYALRAAIAAYLHRSRGVVCTPEQIIISSGTEFLFQLLIQILPSDCLYALENPGYAKLGRLFFGCRAAFAAVDLDRYGIRPDLLRKSGAAVACITPSHQFPTGTIMPVRRRTELLHWAAEQPERYLIEDDYDSEFKHEGRSIPALQGMDTRHRVIYMGTFSKSISSAMRVSYMVLPIPLLTVYQKRLTFYHCPVPLLEQLVLCRFMENGSFERHLNRMRVLYRKKHDVLLEELRRQLPKAEILDANAGLHLLLLPAWTAERRSHRAARGKASCQAI